MLDTDDTNTLSTVSKRRKAAIILRYMIAQGDGLPLTDLPEDVQIALTHELGGLPDIDRQSLSQVAEEFSSELEALALTSSDGITRAAADMAPYLSEGAKDRLLSETAGNVVADPWERLSALPIERRIDIATNESMEVCAIFLSKLAVPDAAELLRLLPGPVARRVAHTMSRTDKATPDVVARIGTALAESYCTIVPRAFSTPSGKRVAAILNLADSATRDALLDALESESPEFGQSIRQSIFTFADIADRLATMDVPTAIRGVEESVLTKGLAFALASGGRLAQSGEHILGNLSKRLAENLREAIAENNEVSAEDGEDAFRAIVTSIRTLEEAGTIKLHLPPS